MHIIGIVSALMLIISCFLPWTYYVSLDETFTGFHVLRFPNGNYYGKAGILITVFTLVVLLFMFINKTWAKRANLFVAGFIMAYAIRAYFVFTNSLFPGEVIKRPGIYMILIFSLLLLVTTLFPKLEEPAK